MKRKNFQKYGRKTKAMLESIIIALFLLSFMFGYPTYSLYAMPAMFGFFLSFIVLSFVQDDCLYSLEFTSEGYCLLTVMVGANEFGTFKFNLKNISVDKLDKLHMQIMDNDCQKNPICIPYCKKLEIAIQQAKRNS